MDGQTDSPYFSGLAVRRPGMHKRTREVKEETWVERGKGADRVKEIMYGRREKTKGKTFRKGRLIKRREVAKKTNREEGEMYRLKYRKREHED